ncbi:hypothetical protein VB779_08715 [Haloarculaceae archaeon H-GB11]|nr:hypothetical protein [Haloarculaceae archaeon H-GB11]
MSAARPVPPEGWYVEVDHPTTGHTFTPRVFDDGAEIPATLNDYPRVSLPVPKHERWQDPAFDAQRAPMRVWYDGDRKPIEELVKPRETERATILEGKGAVDAEQRVQVEYDLEDAHLAAEGLVATNTSYGTDVDAPPNNREDNVSLQTADTENEWGSVLPSLPDDEPIYVTSGGELKTYQTSWLEEAEDANNSVASTTNDSSASAGQYVTILDADNPQYVQEQFTPQYDMPADEVRPSIRIRSTDPNNTPGFEVLIDGQAVYDVGSGVYQNSGWNWLTSVTNASPALSSGQSVNVRIGITDETAAALEVDLVGFHDSRYDYTFPSSVNADGYMDGPERHPQQYLQETLDAETGFQVVGGRLESTWDDTSNSQQIAISQDRGQSWTTASNASAVETDWGSGTPSTRARFGISRYGTSSSESPATGRQSQAVDLYDLQADLDRTPLLVNQYYDASLMDVLQQQADYAEAIFEFIYNESTDSIELIWTAPGQRTAMRDAAATAYDYGKDLEGRVERVVIKGGARQQDGEAFTADHGTAVVLQHSNIDHGSEVVVDPSTDTEFQADSDYDLTASTGEITTLADGDISDGQSLEISYRWHPEGEYTVSGAGSPPDTLVRSLPPLVTERGCTQAARQLALDLDEPLREATVTLSTSASDWQLTDAQAFDALPTDETLTVREITTSPGSTTVRLGSRRSIDEAVATLRQRLNAVASRA